MLVTTSPDLAAACDRLAAADFITVDTEFLRETTFWPKLCLVQLADDEGPVVIDALAPELDLGPLFRLLSEAPVQKVFHAARQDIEIVWNLAKTIPAPVFDTQIAAMVLGYGDSVSYDQLVSRVAGAAIDKSHRFTDWSRRPLSPEQLAYAQADVTHLRTVYRKLARELERRDRAEWMREEMAILTSPDTYRVDPETAWQRLRPRGARPRELAVLIEVAAWREREAQSRDVPRGRVLKDDAVLDIAARAPASIAELGALRALPKGYERSSAGEEIVAAVQRGLARDPATLPAAPKPRAQPQNGSGATLELLKVLLKMIAERHGVAPKVIATTEDLEQIAQSDTADVAALQGWRRQLFGEKALQLKAGALALSIDHGRVVARANEPSATEEGQRRSGRRGSRGRSEARRPAEEPGPVSDAG